MTYDFSYILKQKRLAKEFSIKELAQKVDITAKYLSSIENGRRVPSAKVLSRLLESLNMKAFSDLPFFKDKKTKSFIEKITPLISKIDENNLDAISEMMKIMASKK
jgi:transcriptional regulator with XRE-family HTH domain